jgi:rod shape determining protein RodA
MRGAESWYRLGPITFEPVELAKIILIILLAKYFSMRHIEIYRIRHIVVSGLYMFLPSALVFIQPDIGSVMILLATWFGVMIISGIKIKHIFVLLILGVVFIAVSWSFALQDYQKERLLSFINSEVDPRGSGYNVAQSVIAIGSGGFLGKGLGEGTQTQLGFLPEAQTDFIYAAIVEEMGLLGGILLLACFVFLLRRIMAISRSAQNNFARLVAAGFSVMIVSQIFVNIGMNLGILPITGLPLPFVSYGGSSMISLFTMLGVLQSIKVNS